MTKNSRDRATDCSGSDDQTRDQLRGALEIREVPDHDEPASIPPAKAREGWPFTFTRKREGRLALTSAERRRARQVKEWWSRHVTQWKECLEVFNTAYSLERISELRHAPDLGAVPTARGGLLSRVMALLEILLTRERSLDQVGDMVRNDALMILFAERAMTDREAGMLDDASMVRNRVSSIGSVRASWEDLVDEALGLLNELEEAPRTHNLESSSTDHERDINERLRGKGANRAIDAAGLISKEPEWISRRDLKDLGLPPTSVDRDFNTYGEARWKKGEGSGGHHSFHRDYLKEFVVKRWNPRG